MSFNFVQKEFSIGTGVPTFQFYRRGFTLGGGETPSYTDIVLSGVGALTLSNSLANGINYVKLFGGCEQRNLPEGYTEVEYLKNNMDTQVEPYVYTKLDTGIVPQDGDILEVRYTVLTDALYSSYTLQSRNSSTAPVYGISGSQNSNTILGSINNNGTALNVPSEIIRQQNHTYYVKVSFINGIITLYVKDETTGDEDTQTNTYTWVDTNSSYYIWGNSANSLMASQPISFAKITNNGVVRLHYLSATDSNNVAGFYDFVNNTFISTMTVGSVTAGSAVTSPTPNRPIDIWCNNGVLKFGGNITDDSITGQGTFVTPDSQTLNRIYKVFGKLKANRYKIEISGNFEFILQYKNVSEGRPTIYGNIDTWATSGEYVLDNADYYYGIAIRYPDNNNITPSNFNGTISLVPLFVYTDGTVEKVEVTGNLVDFNETRINSSTWDSANKTKGFEVYADVYNKSIGDSMLTNANAFGVFVPCKQGESVSLNFFDYVPFSTRCLYCEITADRKCNTTPQAYENAGVITQKTFTLTKSDSIGFIIEWWINNQQTRNYTKENYTVIKGETPPTSYIPYYYGGSATAQDLLAISTYKDEQNITTGGVTRKVGIKVLDGTEGFNTYSFGNNAYYITLSDASITTSDVIGVNCTHFRAVSYSDRTASIDNMCYLIPENENQPRYLVLRNMDFATVNALNTYLADQYNAGTPVIIIYPLATPTTETVTAQALSTQAGTNVVSITQASIDNLSLEVSYKATV